MKLQELCEAKSTGGINTIVKYLERKLGTSLIPIQGVEHFKNSSHSGYGLRYIYKGSTKSLRFNWASPSVGSPGSLQSIDYWDGTSHDPAFSITAKDISMAKVLPNLAKILSDPHTGTVTVFQADKDTDSAPLTEARKGDFTAEQALNDFFKQLQSGKSFTRSDFGGAYHSENIGIFDTILRDFSGRFKIDGKRISMPASGDAAALRAEIMKNAGQLIVSSGGSQEEYMPSKAETEIEERVPFSDTLDHLSSLTKSLAKGAFNALFIAGKGGCVSNTTPINIILKQTPNENDNNQLADQQNRIS